MEKYNNWKLKFYTIWAGQAVSLITSAILQMAIIDNLKSPDLQKVAAEVFAPANRYCLQYC